MALVIFLAGCATTRNQTSKNVFSFEHEGLSYQIISINTSSGEGTNFLNLTDENGNDVISVRDLDQDGILDVVLKGNISLEEANYIYMAGIMNAKLKGSYNEREPLRSFEVTRDNTHYTVRSYYVEDFTLTNMFIIHNEKGIPEFILEDLTGDGTLDKVEKGAILLEKAQPLYTAVLTAGIESGRIVLLNGTYIVSEKNFRHDDHTIVVSNLEN